MYKVLSIVEGIVWVCGVLRGDMFNVQLGYMLEKMFDSTFVFLLVHDSM